MRLTHLTSTTGHLATSTRDEVGEDVIAALMPLVRTEGGQVPQTPEWWVDLWWRLEQRAGEDPVRVPGAAVFQVARGPATSAAGQRAYVMGVACWREEVSEEAWQQAQHLAGMFPPDNLPPVAPPVPWLSVAVLPFAALLPPERVRMLGDFERCLFWALVEDDDAF